MAGNLVKWWKHKILGGYKQFSVQECTTDSEELMYHQVRASSSCSAPPDLLLVSDRENNIPLRSPVVNIIAATAASTTAPPTTTTSPSSGINACHLTSATNNNQQRHNQKLQYHQQHQQQQPQSQPQHHQVTTQQLALVYNNGTKDINGSSNGGGNVGSGGGSKHQKQSANTGNNSKQHVAQLQPTQDMQTTSTVTHDVVEGQIETQATTVNNHSSSKQQAQQHHNHHHHHHQQQQQQHQRSDDHIRLEEFTCDVSVEGGKSSQPLQFSFTFYDLDGHHGKITKDDIVGIVYTIYESIGKSVVVPHSGSKTINVRLTVSPEGKSKGAKNKKALDHSLNTHQKATALASNTQAAAAARRLHRYRPRKLIKSDEEDDDSNSDKERIENLSHVLAHKSNSKTQKFNKLKAEQNCCTTQQQTLAQHTVVTDLPNSPLDTIYDNLKASSPAAETCRECLAAVDETRNTSISPLVSAATTTTPTQFPAASKTTANTPNEAYMKHVASTRIKMLRKSRKQKHQDGLEIRQRSLSVGNETCWKNRHLQSKHPPQQHLLWQAEQQLNHSVGVGDVVDGVQLRNPLKNSKTVMAAQKRNSAECWKTALNRNDLISIIRESMEKNRLCFQLNGKPQANVSPIRQQTNNLQQQQQQQQSQTHNHQQIANTSSSTNNNNNTKHSQITCAQRQRSNTISKIPTLIANHNNAAAAAVHHHSSVSPQHRQRSSSCANTTSNNNNNNSSSQQHDINQHEHHNNTNSSSISSNNIYHHHLQPHIPIYHQQMAINPAVIAAQNALLTAGTSGNVVGPMAGHHGKMNLCGYDSFLHATICGGGLSHSPPPPPPPQASINHTSLNTQITSSSTANHHSSSHQQQQIATVQPIMSNNTQHASKHLSLAVTPNQIKTSKILRSGSYANQTQTTPAVDTPSNPITKQNSPQYHGYQRLPSSSKHNLSALHLLSPHAEKRSLSELEKWRRDQVKNYDQLLYDKLSEKLQQTNLVARENNQRRKQRLLRQRRANALVQETNNVSLAATVLTNSLCLRGENAEDYNNAMMPIVGDAAECENLLGHTSEEETHSQHDALHLKAKEEVTNNKQQHRHVAEGTLVDLDDVSPQAPTTAQNVQLAKLNVDTLLSVANEAEAQHNLHTLVDDLDIDEELEDDLDDELEVLADVADSGRNSTNSNSNSNANATAAATATATLVNSNNNSNTTTNTSTNSSSLIHRYVHEHIHHHYHHFEEKEE